MIAIANMIAIKFVITVIIMIAITNMTANEIAVAVTIMIAIANMIAIEIEIAVKIMIASAIMIEIAHANSIDIAAAIVITIAIVILIVIVVLIVNLITIVEKYIPNGEWSIESLTYASKENKYSCCQFNFSEVSYTFVLRRKPLYHLVYLIVPCMVISALVLVNFVTPADSGERISLCITILLAMSVYLMMVGDDLPEDSDDLPLLGVCYIAIMVQITCAVVATAIVLRCHHASKKPPKWILRLFKHEAVSSKGIKDEDLLLENKGMKDKDKESEKTAHVKKESLLVEKKKKEEKENRKVWQTIGKRLDNFFLVIFFLIFVITACAVFLQVPYIFNSNSLEN